MGHRISGMRLRRLSNAMRIVTVFRYLPRKRIKQSRWRRVVV